MEYPRFMKGLPTLDLPFDEEDISTNVVGNEHALVVYFTVHNEVVIPEHSHGPQWGALFHGSIELTVDGVTRHCVVGDTWDIPEGVPHSAILKAGSRFMDVFAESDRYPLRD